MLGQLVHYRVDPLQREKFEASTRPGLFAGWRYGDGPKSHLGVYLVLDYAKVKGRESGFANSIAVPAEELYVEEGPAKLPVKVAADEALATFSDARLEEIQPLDIPFSSISPDTRVKRNEYITLDRIIKYGPSVGCKACAFSSEHIVCIVQHVVHASTPSFVQIERFQAPKRQVLQQHQLQLQSR